MEFDGVCHIKCYILLYTQLFRGSETIQAALAVKSSRLLIPRSTQGPTSPLDRKTVKKEQVTCGRFPSIYQRYRLV